MAICRAHGGGAFGMKGPLPSVLSSQPQKLSLIKMEHQKEIIVGHLIKSIASICCFLTKSLHRSILSIKKWEPDVGMKIF